jgi:hypothetical protein
MRRSLSTPRRDSEGTRTMWVSLGWFDFMFEWCPKWRTSEFRTPAGKKLAHPSWSRCHHGHLTTVGAHVGPVMAHMFWINRIGRCPASHGGNVTAPVTPTAHSA